MSEIEKLYENAGIEKQWEYSVHQFGNIYKTDKEGLIKNDYLFYERKTAKVKSAKKTLPPFTPAKQLELIKLLSQQCDLCINCFRKWEFVHYDGQRCLQVSGSSFEETLAGLINNLWQDLTDTEKAEIKRILED